MSLEQKFVKISHLAEEFPPSMLEDSYPGKEKDPVLAQAKHEEYLEKRAREEKAQEEEVIKDVRERLQKVSR